MGKFTVSHEINCSVDTFWKLFFDRDFNVKLYKERLGFPVFTVDEQKETDAEIIRRCSGKPKMNMPGPVMKLLGDSFSYKEEGRFDKAKKTWTWKMIPSALADKLRQEGTMRVEAVGDNKCRRVADLINEAKIFGLGGLIESSAEKELRKGWDESAKFFNQWIADGKAG